MPKITIDEEEFEIATWTEKIKSLTSRIQQTERSIAENKNMLAVLLKARRAYISDLKSEVIAKKSGFNFNED